MFGNTLTYSVLGIYFPLVILLGEVPRHASQVSSRAFGMLKKLTLIKSKEKVAQLDMFQVKELKKLNWMRLELKCAQKMHKNVHWMIGVTPDGSLAVGTMQ